MLIAMKQGSTRDDLARVCRAVEDLGFHAHVLTGSQRTAVAITGNPGPIDPTLFEALPGVAEAIAVTRPWTRAGRDAHPEDTVIRIGNARIGSGSGPFVVAGPCAVESEEQILSVARILKDAGADALRGGAYKPRSSPYSFQGLGRDGVHLLAKAKEATGLPVVTEAVDEASLEQVLRVADIVQIGARNMQNYALLKRAGRCGRPVLLKRGLSATAEELLLSAEYLLDAGNPEVILCERGIRTFSQHSRYTLDLSIVPALRELSHLPVFVDPSHATGHSERVAPMARAAVAAGADGVLFEVHPAPERALSDARPAAAPGAARELIAQLRELAPIVSRRTEALR